MDMNGELISMNPAAERILGVKAKQIKTVENIKDHVKQIHEDGSDYPVEEGPAFLSLRTGQPVNNQVMGVFNKQEGAFRWVNISAVPQFKSGENKPYQVFITFDDITGRKKAEESLRESEERYRALVDLGADFGQAIVLQQDTEKGIAIQIFVNDEWSRITGYPKDELIGMSFANLIHPEYRNAAIDRYKKRLGGELASSMFEVSIFRKDGSEVPIEGIASRTTYKGKPGVVGYFRDISDRKKAEKVLLESEERYRAIIDLGASFNEAIVMTQDTEQGTTIHVYANEEWSRITGYSNEELIGTPYRNVIHPKYRKEVLGRYQRRLKTEALPLTYEFSVIRKDGTEVLVEAVGSFTTYRGKPACVGYFRDITERKQTEEREKQLQEELTMTSRLASIGEMAAGIAHEINNPLTGVVGFSSLLLQKDLPDDVRKDLNLIYGGAQRVASITRRMLTFARQQKQEKTSVNINDIIETTFEMRTYALNSSNIKLVKQLEGDLPRITADAGQLQQVFLNIILNAETEMVKANGGGNLLVKTEKADSIIRISFKDDGPGIPKENLRKVFDPFFTTREVGQGAGLGLSVSHGIVTQHGGRIYAKSKPRKGATFVIELPIVIKDEQLEMKVPTTEVIKAASRARVLIVDDEPSVQQYLNDVLTGEGYDIEIIDNGEEALGKLGSEDYDVILLDIKLPGMNGIEIYKQLQKKDKSKARKVIFHQ